jgi:hypothetical protein
MIKLRVLKKYHDNALDKNMEKGDILDVREERAMELLAHPLGLVEILAIDKISSKKNAKTSSRKKRK